MRRPGSSCGWCPIFLCQLFHLIVGNERGCSSVRHSRKEDDGSSVITFSSAVFFGINPRQDESFVRMRFFMRITIRLLDLLIVLAESDLDRLRRYAICEDPDSRIRH